MSGQIQTVIPTIFHATLADLRRRLVAEAHEFRQQASLRPRPSLKMRRVYGRALVSRQILALAEYELIATLSFNELRSEFSSLPSYFKRKVTRTWRVLTDTLNSLQPRLLRLERGHPASHHERVAHWRSTCGAFNCGKKAFKKLLACGKNLIKCYQKLTEYNGEASAHGEDAEFIGLRSMRL